MRSVLTIGLEHRNRRRVPRCLASRENNLHYSDERIEAAAPVIAGGLIVVPDNAGVISDARLPTTPNRFGALMFDKRGCG